MDRKVFRVVRKQEPYSLDESKPVQVKSSVVVRRSKNTGFQRRSNSQRAHVYNSNYIEARRSSIVRRSAPKSTSLKVVRRVENKNNDKVLNHIIRFDNKPAKKVSTVSRPIVRTNGSVRIVRGGRPTAVKKYKTGTNKLGRAYGTLKKALLIGINYSGTDFELGGCINDSKRLGNFLVSKRYFKSGDITMMNDEFTDNRYPTKENIMKQLKQIVNFTRTNRARNIELFVSYSGHGYYVKDTNGDEVDGKDEVLCPVDCDTQGYITDDTLREEFIDKLPRNVKLVMLVDACHSGTVLDLRYSYKADASPITMNNWISNTQCDVVMISGCRDNQTSADAFLENPDKKKYEYQGAMTASFLDNYTERSSYDGIISKMRTWLKDQSFDQVPQLSSGKFINVNSPFLLTSYR